jgi:cytochrome c553
MIWPARSIGSGTTVSNAVIVEVVRRRRAQWRGAIIFPGTPTVQRGLHERTVASRMKLMGLVAMGIAVFAVSEGNAAGSAAAGRQKAAMCQTCHGFDGRTMIPEAPNLAGQPDIYLVKALKDFRSGARKNEMMSLVASTLKDQDIDDLAAYYSAIEVTIKPPPK